MTQPRSSAIETALLDLLRTETAPEHLRAILRHPVLLTEPARQAVRTLLHRADTPRRQEKFAWLLDLIQTAAELAGAAPAPPPAAPDIADLYEFAATTVANRAAILEHPRQGPAWAGGVLATARILNGMRSFGHGLGTPTTAPLARQCAADLRRAADIFDSGGAPFDAAHARQELANLLWHARDPAVPSRPDQALSLALRALRIFRRSGDRGLAARSHHLAGTLYRERPRGDLVRNQERAIRHLAHAFEGFRAAEQPTQAAEALHSACAVWAERIAGDARENFRVAEHCHRAARAIWRDARDTLNIARADYLWATSLMSRPYQQAAANQAAIRLLRRVLGRLGRMPDHPQARRLAAEAASVLGQAWRQRGAGRRAQNLRQAEAAFAGALDLTDRDASPDDWARHRLRQAVLSIDLIGQDDVAAGEKGRIAEARRAIGDVIATMRPSPDARMALVVRYWDGVIAAHEGDWPRAATCMRAAAADRALLLNAQTFPDGRLRVVELLSGLASLGTYAIWHAEGAEAAFLFLAGMRQAFQPGVPSRQTRPAVAVPTIGAKEAIVAPLMTPFGGVVLVLARGDPGGEQTVSALPLPGLRSSDAQSVLSRWIGACLRVGNGDPLMNPVTFDNELALVVRWFSRHLGGKLRAHLRQAGVPDGTLLRIVPSGGLSLVPLHALRTERGDVLWDAYPILYQPSFGRAVSRHEPPSGARRALIVSDPDGTLGSAAASETAAVQARMAAAGLETAILRGEAATARAVLAAMDGAAMLHVVSHGFFDWRDPQGSGVIMAGNQALTARIVSSRARLSDCMLCMLSACETGLADPGARADSFVSLAGAFLEAGAGTVVASLWPVPNQATSALVTDLYDDLLADGMAPAHALRQAALRMRDQAGGHVGLARLTIAWAPFVSYTSMPRESRRHGSRRRP